MRVVEEGEERFGAVARVPEPGRTVIPASSHVVLTIGVEVEVAHGLCVRIVQNRRAFHRAQVVESDVLV